MKLSFIIHFYYTFLSNNPYLMHGVGWEIIIFSG